MGVRALHKRPTVAELRRPRTNAFVHVFAHAVDGVSPFREAAGRRHLLATLASRLDPSAIGGHEKFASTIELLAYAIMPNHFHLLLWQRSDREAISRFMRNVLRVTATDFNSATGRRGAVFIRPYGATWQRRPIDVKTAIAYIHRNPREPKRIEEDTSHPIYVGAREPGVVKPQRALDLFGGPDEYARFFDAYCSARR